MVSDTRSSRKNTQQATESPPSVRKSKRLENETPPLIPPMKRTSERLGKCNTLDSLRRSGRGKKELSSRSASKESTEDALSKSKKEKDKTVIQVTMESEKAELDPEVVGMKRKNLSYRKSKALFKRQGIAPDGGKEQERPENFAGVSSDNGSGMNSQGVEDTEDVGDDCSKRVVGKLRDKSIFNVSDGALPDSALRDYPADVENDINVDSCIRDYVVDDPEDKDSESSREGSTSGNCSKRSKYYKVAEDTASASLACGYCDLEGTCLLCSKIKRVRYDLPEQELCSCSPMGEDLVDVAESSTNDAKVLCGLCSKDGDLLTCEGKDCRNCYHLLCLDPPLTDALPGAWHCPQCVKKKLLLGVHSVSTGVESIYGIREVVVPNAEGVQRQFLVKYNGLAHVHNHWVPDTQLHLETPCLVSNFLKKKKDAGWNAKWMVPHRLLWKRPIQEIIYVASTTVIWVCRYEWLVKWRDLDYDHATWELDNAKFLSSSIGQDLVRNYEVRRGKAKSEANKPHMEPIIGCSEIPGGSHETHVLENVNKVRKFLLKCPNAVVIDEQERTTTATHLIHSMIVTFRSFLIVATLDSLSRWEADFERLAPSVDVVVYSGSVDTRNVIRASEFYDEEGRCIVQVLLSSVEAVLEDLEILKKIKWKAIVIDEYQYSGIPEGLEQIKMLSTDMRVLIVSSQIKDATSEYLKILSFVEPQGDFDKLRSLKSETNDNLSILKDRLSPFIQVIVSNKGPSAINSCHQSESFHSDGRSPLDEVSVIVASKERIVPSDEQQSTVCVLQRGVKTLCQHLPDTDALHEENQTAPQIEIAMSEPNDSAIPVPPNSESPVTDDIVRPEASHKAPVDEVFGQLHSLAVDISLSCGQLPATEHRGQERSSPQTAEPEGTEVVSHQSISQADENLELHAYRLSVVASASNQPNEAVMEKDVAVPQAMVSTSGQPNQAIMENDVVEPQATVSTSGQPNQAVTENDVVEPQAMVSTSEQPNQAVMENDVVEPQAMVGTSEQPNQSVMENYVVEPQAMVSTSGQPNQAVMENDVVELQAMVSTSEQPNQAVMENDVVEPQAMVSTSGQPNQAVMENDVVEPQAMVSTSEQPNQAVIENDVVVPEGMVSTSGQPNQDIMENDVVVLQAMVSTSEQPNQDVSNPPVVGIDAGNLHGPDFFLNSTDQPIWSSVPPSLTDPLQNEIVRVQKETEQLEKSHADMIAQLKADCEKEIEKIVAQVRNKYEVKSGETDAEFRVKMNELDKNQNKVCLNKILANSFRSTHLDGRPSVSPSIQQGASTSMLPPSVRPSPGPSASQPAPSPTSAPTAAAARSCTLPTTSPAVQQPSWSHLMRSCPSAIRNMTAHPIQGLQRAAAHVSGNSARPPVISAITPADLRASSEIRSLLPHLQSCRPVAGASMSAPPSSSSSQLQPIQTLPRTPSQPRPPLVAQNSSHVRGVLGSPPGFTDRRPYLYENRNASVPDIPSTFRSLERSDLEMLGNASVRPVVQVEASVVCLSDDE